MKRQPPPIVWIESGEPWHLSCRVERVGRDYVCRVHGGDQHIGAVALSEWRSGRALAKCLTVCEHKEGEIAVHASRALCAASRRNVCCIAGIHFEALTRAEIEEILKATYALTGRVARELEDRRREPGAMARGGSPTEHRSRAGLDDAHGQSNP